MGIAQSRVTPRLLIYSAALRAAKEHGVPFKAIHIQSREEAQYAPTPITTYALFCDGEYVTNEQMNEARFLKMLSR